MEVLKASLLVISLFKGCLSLECPSCIHVDYESGSVQVSSMTTFVNDTQNSLCKNSPGSVPTKTCPDVGYECGSLDEKINVYAHLVGEVNLHFYYRDCVKKPLLSQTFLKCLDSQVEETMFMMLWDKVPDSIISQQPGGACYCRRIEGCEALQPNSNGTSSTQCPDRYYRVFGKCYEWWIILVIIVDIIIILLLILLITCCLWWRCPLYYKRDELKEREYKWRGRRHSAPEPNYYVRPAVVPAERTNIAMPGFGAPMVMEADHAPVAPPSHYALAGGTGYVQPNIYNRRYYLNDEEEQRSSLGRFTWRSRQAPKRFRTVYDIQRDNPDDDDDPYY